MNAAAFFEQPSGVKHPAYILIKIIKRLCQQVSCPGTMEGGEITAYESETLDYIGGYALRRALRKFGSNPVITMLSAEPKKNSLIKLMEKKTGSLYCPSEHLSYFIQHIYLKLALEFSKNPRHINIKVFTECITQEQYFHRFTERIQWGTSDFSSDLAREVAAFILQGTVRLLAKGFTKNVFQNIRSSCFLSRGLRGDLKRQVRD